MRWILAAALVFAALPAHAQFAACSQTVGATAAPVAFATTPRHYVEICNAHATNTLAVPPAGGTAVIGAAGTRTRAAVLCWAWKDQVLSVISVIGSAASTTTACQYN